jgi:hypothetical protein
MTDGVFWMRKATLVLGLLTSYTDVHFSAKDRWRKLRR